MNRPSWEVLVGSWEPYEALALFTQDEERQPNALQERVEQIIATELTEHEQEIFWLRFGEGLGYREMAERMGYKSHQTFQYQVDKILEIVRLALEQRLDSGDIESSD